MRSIYIMNENLLDILEDFRYTYIDKYAISDKTSADYGVKNGADWYTSDEHLKEVMSLGTRHEGFADKGYSFGLKPSHYIGDRREEYIKDWERLDREIKIELGVEHSALSQLYPPNGFIGWHNNANASAYNLILTWSETGDGWFKYVDPKTGEMVTMQDKKGWSLKAGYFGEYNSGCVVYHAARTNCTRMTLSYVLGHDRAFWEDCIEHISST